VSPKTAKRGTHTGNSTPSVPRTPAALRSARDIIYIPKCRRCGEDDVAGIGLCHECMDDPEWVRK